MTTPPSETRIALLRSFGGDDSAEDSAMAEAGLTAAGADVTGPRLTKVWTAGANRVAVTQLATNDQLAAIAFAGPGHVDLAARLAARLSYLPEVLLHRAARTAPSAPERRDALRALGQLHSASDGVLRWDRRLRATLDVAWGDRDRSVRIDAAAVELDCHPAQARAHLGDVITTDPDDDLREALATLLRLSPTVDIGRAEVPALTDDADGPLALPFLWAAPLHDLLSFFGNATVHSEEQVRWNDETATVIQMDPIGFDARITVASAGGGVAVAGFAGVQQTATAIGSAAVLHYLPEELAMATLRHGRDAALRIIALRATAIALLLREGHNEGRVSEGE